MSTPSRPNPYPRRSDRPTIRNSVIRRPTRECKKRVASPIRHNPSTRRAPKEVKNAPKAKRVRQSRLNLDNFSPYESNSPRPSNVAQISPLTRFNLPIQRLQFENEDFMDLYTDDNNHRPDSVAFLSQCLSDALMMEPGVSPRLSTLRPRSSLRTPESQYRFNQHRKDHTAKLTPKRTHASDKKN
ncbi:unnamed protein product [Caenorhabditis brenneri]